MSLFAGMAAGFGEGQGQYNAKMLDFINQKNQTLATMYSHLADNAQDQEVAAEFTKRAMGWAGANPMLDPKGYKELIKGEKVGLHDLVDQIHQKKVSDYHQQTFGQPTQQAQQPAALTGANNAPQPPTQPANVPAPVSPQMFGEQGPGMSGGAPPQPQSPQAASNPLGGISPPPTPQTASGGPPGSPAPPPDLDQFIRHGLPPEPPMYGSMGRLNPEWQHWHEIYTKKMEGTVATPAGMQGYVGAPFMSAGFASPYASMMGREITANARAYGSGAKLDPVTHQFVPLQPEEYSLVQQLKMQKDAAQADMYKAVVPLRQMMAQYYGEKTKLIPIEMQAILRRLDIAQQHLNLSELSTNARIFGRDATGNPIPGALAMDDGAGNMTPVGSMWGHNVLPTGATQSKAETAIPVMQQTNKLYDFAANPDNADLFGRVQGNLMDWMASGRNMTTDPREGPLRADLISLASLMVPLHGFRSQKAAEEFLGRLSQGLTPEQFMGAVRAFNSVGMQLYQNGMPNLINAQGGVSPRLPLPPGQTKPASGKPTTSGPPSNLLGSAQSGATQKDYIDAAMASGWDGRTRPVPTEIKQKAEALLRRQGKLGPQSTAPPPKP